MGLIRMLIGEEPGIINTILHYKNKGQFGEYATEFALTHDNILGYFKTLHNIYLPYKGKTTEIDILLIHAKGIFVFESKNYSGWIYGKEDALKWTQILGRQKNQFYNPIRQNETHKKALAAFLDLEDAEDIGSYIVFSNRCKLKKVPHSKSYKIVRRIRMLRKLRRQLSRRDEIFSKDEVDEIYDKLFPLTNVSRGEKKEHIKAIKNCEEGFVCPYCGGELTLRKGKYGYFYGCSNYPHCRFTIKA